MKTRFSRAFAPLLTLACSLSPPASAGTLKTIYTFTGGADGAYPASALVAGPDGNFYGTTLLGGSGCSGTGCGTIFQLTPPKAGSTKWGFTTLFTFGGGSDGEEPVNLTVASNGTLYGVAEYGGLKNCSVSGVLLGCGTVFALIPPVTGTAWTFFSLYEFTGATDGRFPSYGLTRDASGNLYGTTLGDGTCATGNCGSVFELSPPQGTQNTWQLATLHSFTGGTDGSTPYSTPLLDSAGNVYASTSSGGYTGSSACLALGGCGTVLKLAPPAAGKTAWKKTTLWTFTGADGIAPQGSLLADTAGNLYGTANTGGKLTTCLASGSLPPGCGTVYELTPPAAGATKWTRTLPWRFGATTDGLLPDAGPIVDGTSTYVTTSGNGLKGFGSIVKLTPPAAGKTAWTESVEFDFLNDANGAQPAASLLLSGATLYGTTLGHDGAAPARYGTIFSLTP